jgi:hypothetical protein
MDSPMRSVAALAGLVVCLSGCAQRATIQKVEADTYRVTCTALPLDRCLGEAASNACDKRAYFVERAVSQVNLRGVTEAPEAATSSEAIIRCAPGKGWGDQAKELMAGSAGSTSCAPSSSKPSFVCTPGSTQACVGVAACSGGQACKSDGSGYEPCACASASVSPPAAAEASPAATPTTPGAPSP